VEETNSDSAPLWRRRAYFCAALAAMGVINALVRMPASMGNAHWSEWFAFYFTPPIFWGLVIGLVCWAVIPAPPGGRKRDVRLPLRGIALTAGILTALAYFGSR
jgi:hypothetical protein